MVKGLGGFLCFVKTLTSNPETQTPAPEPGGGDHLLDLLPVSRELAGLRFGGQVF